MLIYLFNPKKGRSVKNCLLTLFYIILQPIAWMYIQLYVGWENISASAVGGS